ncbi:hypothetical protein D3C87_1510200 [compost metagenome]
MRARVGAALCAAFAVAARTAVKRGAVTESQPLATVSARDRAGVVDRHAAHRHHQHARAAAATGPRQR